MDMPQQEEMKLKARVLFVVVNLATLKARSSRNKKNTQLG